MTTSEPETADAPDTITTERTVRVRRLPTGKYLEEEGGRHRVFLAEEAAILYKQEFETGLTRDESLTAWEITVTVSGRLITSGVPGKRSIHRTYYDEPGSPSTVPDWLDEYVDRYHPAKRP